MKRMERDPERFDTLRILDAFARSRGLSLTDPTDQAAVLKALTQAASQGPQNEILVHGLRVESMFAYVAGALGYSLAVKEEDAGSLYSPDPELAAPDFRVITRSGSEFLVEVKNCHQVGLDFRYRLTSRYYRRLTAYAALFSRQLKFAIYWSRPRLWTLLPAEAFEASGEYHSLSMEQCIKRNEMSLLGDAMVGTVPPVEFRLFTDPEKPRSVDAGGHAQFTIGGAELWCGSRRVIDPFEKKLAWFLLQFGGWEGGPPEAEIVDGQLLSTRFIATKQTASGQEFAIIGQLSQMISRQFNELTAPEGQIVRLAPSQDPEKLGIVIPADYKGDVVRLWRFVLQPNYD